MFGGIVVGAVGRPELLRGLNAGPFLAFIKAYLADEPYCPLLLAYCGVIPTPATRGPLNANLYRSLGKMLTRVAHC